MLWLQYQMETFCTCFYTVGPSDNKLHHLNLSCSLERRMGPSDNKLHHLNLSHSLERRMGPSNSTISISPTALKEGWVPQTPPSQSLLQPWKKDGSLKLHHLNLSHSLERRMGPSNSTISISPAALKEGWVPQIPSSQSLLQPQKKGGSLKLHHLNLSICLKRRVASSTLLYKRLHSTRTHLKTFLDIHHTSGLPASWGGGQSFTRDVFKPFCGGWCCWSLGHLGHWGHSGGLLLQLGAGLLVGALVSRLWGPLALADARGVHAACPHLQLK